MRPQTKYLILTLVSLPFPLLFLALFLVPLVVSPTEFGRMPLTDRFLLLALFLVSATFTLFFNDKWSRERRRNRGLGKPSKPAPRKLFVYAMVILALSPSALGFWFLWEDHAVALRSQGAQTFSRQGENITDSRETTVVFENYLPGTRSFLMWFTLTTFDFRNRTLTQTTQVIHTASELLDAGIRVNETTRQLFYGDQPLGPPIVVAGHIFRSRQVTPGLSELHLTINWSHSKNVTGAGIARLISEVRSDFPQGVIEEPIFGSDLTIRRLEASLQSYLLRVVLPIAAFALSGFGLAFIARDRLGRLPDELEALPWNYSRLESILRELAFRPNSLSYVWSVGFAAAITLLKLSIRMKVTRLLNSSKFHRLGLEDGLKKFLSDSSTKPASGLFELRTVGLILGFLASVGLTFSFNAGAIGPFLLTVGVMYLTLNFGFLFFLTKRVPTDRWRVPVFILLTAIVLAFSKIIADVRAFL